MDISVLLEIYKEIKKESGRKGYVSPIEILIWKIENDINSKSFVGMMLSKEDLANLRRLPMISIGQDGREIVGEANIERDELWIRNYIRRKRKDLYENIIIFVKNDTIYILSKGLMLR